jgi:hypothetical protein
MDEGPFRAPQPAERRVPSRQEATPRQVVEKVEPVKETPHVTRRVEIPPIDEPKKRRSFKKGIILAVVILALLAAAFFGWSAWSKAQNSAKTAINTSEYQAVFFTNGQVYFGKLEAFNNDYMKLTNIYYLQTQSSTSTSNSTNPQNSATDSNNVQLIKLGSEIHGPEDQMVISKQQMLFYENLKPDGKVAQSIANYSKAK